MGSGIAEVSARAGVDVTVVEADAARIDAARVRIERSLERAVRRGKLDEGDRRSRSSGSRSRPARGPRGQRRHHRGDRRGRAGQARALHPARRAAARRALAGVQHVVRADHEARGRHQAPERVLGLHFFNPVPVLKLVEVVRSIMSADEPVEDARRFAEDGSARRASTRRTGPASSSTRC